MRLRLGILLLLLFSASACTTGGSGSSEPRRDRNRLSQEELDEWNQLPAWDVVQRLGPMWMRPGGVRNSANPAGHYAYVFVDGSPYGPMESLRSFRVENIQEMRFVDATDATIRYGGHTRER